MLCASSGARAALNISAKTINKNVGLPFVVQICFCEVNFPLPLGVWEGLRFVIVALPGLFSYLFFQVKTHVCSPTGLPMRI